MPRVPSPAAVRIGELISDARKRRGITQDELAVLTQIDSSNIRGYEKGRSMMGIPTLIRIADALRVEPGELLNDVTPEMFNVLATDGRRRAH
ncbi:helix-turn-helix domain-containing protein [Microbacterium arabinogalactanolyticum]|uniref:helix-turn-helix domain-containing protein n=1 Tax=Microbacterium arabinogalactanolyticum TaxID=69365 RepID=UPI004043C831